jgi:hypothetical protein
MLLCTRQDLTRKSSSAVWRRVVTLKVDGEAVTFANDARPATSDEDRMCPQVAELVALVVAAEGRADLCLARQTA